MNRVVMDRLVRSVSDHRDRRHNDYRDGRDYRDNRDYRDSRDSRDYERDRYEDERYDDSRRSSRGSMRSRDRRDYEDGTYHAKLKLDKTDLTAWEEMLDNADGTKGPHFTKDSVMHAAEKLGVKFENFSEKEFCLTMNMMYSDYCMSIKKFVAPEDEAMMCASMAWDFLEDVDAPSASEKLTMYFHCIANLK